MTTNRRHFPSCPAINDPAAKCFCPPEWQPRSDFTDDSGEFTLAPPAPAPDAKPGSFINRKGETRGQAATRLRRTRQMFMVRKHGPGPAGMTCATCRFFRRVGGGSRDYSKCTKYGVSSSEATDWSKKWPACRLYEPD